MSKPTHNRKAIKIWHDIADDVSLVRELLYAYTELHGLEFQEFVADSCEECVLVHSISAEKLLDYLKEEGGEGLNIGITSKPLDLRFSGSSSAKWFLISTHSTNFTETNERGVARVVFALVTLYYSGLQVDVYGVLASLLNVKDLSFSDIGNELRELPDFVSTLGKLTFGELPSASHAVITHGIRTHAEWAEPATQILREYKVSASVLRYDWVDTLNFAFNPGARKSYAESLLFRINSAINDHPRKRLTIIVHSFGSIILVKSLEMAEKLGIRIDIDALILSGSIIDQQFNWRHYTEPTKNHGVTVRRVLNVCGDRDQWPVIAKHLVFGAGYSGTYYFADNFANNVVNIRLKGRDHESILRMDIVGSTWGKFLIGEHGLQAVTDIVKPSRKVNAWHKAFVIVKVLLVFACLVFAVVYILA